MGRCGFEGVQRHQNLDPACPTKDISQAVAAISSGSASTPGREGVLAVLLPELRSQMMQSEGRLPVFHAAAAGQLLALCSFMISLSRGQKVHLL